MKLKAKGISYLLFSLCCVSLSSSTFASAPKHNYYKGERHYKDAAPRARNHFEVIGAGGLAKLKAGNSQLGVTSSETDTLVQTNENSWDTSAGQLGVGYVYYFSHAQPYSDNVQWFTSVEPQLNIYQLSSNSIEGDVWRFGSRNFNQLTFDIPVHSTRLMFDTALTLAAWKQFSIYGKAGVGYARTRISYSDHANAGSIDCDQNVKLNNHTNSKFVWEAGAGAQYAFNDRFSLSFEYLYTDLGTVKTAGNGGTGAITTPVLTAPSFSLKSQTAMLGLHIAI